MRYYVIGLMFLLLVLAGCSAQEGTDAASENNLVTVKGRVVVPLERAYLYIYKKGMDLYGPAYTVSKETDAQGHFRIKLSEGDYVGVVRKRADGATVGPVVAGDNRSDFIQIQVRKGMQALDISAPIKVGDNRRLIQQEDLSRTGISGQILDVDGNPVEGIRIQVYDHVQMSERPKYVSEKTGPDGRYRVLLPEGGTYYISARDNFGGPPKLGDLYGRYDQGTIEPSAVVVRKDEILKGVDVRVSKIW